MYSEFSPYASIWSKYRPVILKLMLDADNDPQHYKLFPHEFKAMGIREKTYAFTLEASQGKALNNIKGSTIARDLLQMLQQSRKASELMNDAVYELSMDKHFGFHVAKKEVEVEPEAAVAE